ncbi:hypothetical protein O181_107734 [Austropuccinia psidii MF-1]|uniref:Uncharacterized protein n=1 Tax=Austropuccinia psidii MF-1 TaxID=1389203 RepID=A0A9Q3JTM9_9BASI|nr:hypothetical protein [Austropuccinia psidii MF-1]
MYITLEIETRYHERKKEKMPEASKSVSSHHQNSSRSNQKKKKNFHSKKRDNPYYSFLNKEFKLKGSEKERRLKEGLCAYCGGKHNLKACVKWPQNQLAKPSGKFPIQGKS